METSSNPLTVVTNLQTLAAAAKAANPSAITLVDNTFATPLLINPLSLGVDVVIHALTKYINGHGDVLGGVIVTNDKRYIQEVKHAIIEFGPSLSPFDAWLVLRGLRTLSVRMQCISDTALTVARFLGSHRHVKRMWYPGLPSHPQFLTVCKMVTRDLTAEEKQHGFPFSGMISINLNASDDNDNCDAAKVFIDSLAVFSNQVSLGDYKSLASCPGLSTQLQIAEEDRVKTGISCTTIRLSIGLEHAQDLMDDLDQALLKMSLCRSASHGSHGSRLTDDDVIPPSEDEDTDVGVSVTCLTINSHTEACADTLPVLVPVPSSICVTTSTTSTVNSSNNSSSSSSSTAPSSAGSTQRQRLERMKLLVSQMDSINSEIESLQRCIAQDNEALLLSIVI